MNDTTRYLIAATAVLIVLFIVWTTRGRNYTSGSDQRILLNPDICPGCGFPTTDSYVCRPRCWPRLSEETRALLMRPDGFSKTRLTELRDQLEKKTPLADIKVTA